MNQRSTVVKVLNTKLDRIEQRSKSDPKACFNNLGHLLSLDYLRTIYDGLDGNKAVGIDGVTKGKYGERLEENLSNLLGRIRKGTYYPQASKIVEIPKADGSRRPLAVACFEDKMVQEAVRGILERIYEPIFRNFSYGFRPKRNAHLALSALRYNLNCSASNAVLEIDLRNYFNSIPHEPLLRMLELKVQDRRFLNLIIKCLKAPIQSECGERKVNEVGSPQGSILSPLMANIYLHYVLDIWFNHLRKTKIHTSSRMIRYADDVVFTFYSVARANFFRRLLVERLGKFGISINEEKTRVVESGPKIAEEKTANGEKMPIFTFLGFQHIWVKARNAKTGKVFYHTRWKTCPKRYRAKLREIKEYIQKNRHQSDISLRMKRVVQGYTNYFAINFNTRRCRGFIYGVQTMLFKYMNRRGKRGNFSWKVFVEKVLLISS